jgi:hypothetical protein
VKDLRQRREQRGDLKRANDIEDLRDAWEEYARELRKERNHYVEEMAERGYRSGTSEAASAGPAIGSSGEWQGQPSPLLLHAAT